MINRIVRLSFEPAKTQEFLLLFDSIKHQIAMFEGCYSLKLLRDLSEPNVFYTYSLWKSEEHLNKYRFSEFFKQTWAQTKALFNNKPQAFSLVLQDDVK